MSNKLTQEKIDQMWAAWQERQSLYSVARNCKVAYETVYRYRKLDKWDERLAKIKQKTIEKVDAKQINANAKYVKIANAVINVFAQSLLGIASATCPACNATVNLPIPRPDISAADFDRMVKLIRLELGEADSREEDIIKVIYVNERQYQSKSQAL